MGGGGDDDGALNHPGIAIFASSGDFGYGAQYPAGNGSPDAEALAGIPVVLGVSPNGGATAGGNTMSEADHVHDPGLQVHASGRHVDGQVLHVSGRGRRRRAS